MKPQMILNVRISTESSGGKRYTEDEIKQEILNGNVRIDITPVGKVPLFIRKNDGAVLGEILIK